MMTDIVLTTFNARYAHTAFGLRCLMANLGELADRAELLEFDLSVQPRVAAEKILDASPRIVGIGCYIWNIELSTKVAALIKSISPETMIILGGPEVSYETEQQEIFQYADHVICGEGEIGFSNLCHGLLEAGDTTRTACFQQAFVPQASSLPRNIGFNPHQEVHQSRRKNLPHWTQEGCTYFVTFRLADAIAQLRLKEYEKLIRENLVDIKEDGSIFLDQYYFDYCTGLRMARDDRWEKLFGVARREPESALSQEHCDLALAIQKVTEEIVLKMAVTAKKLTGSANLCLAGGVALNCVANARLNREKIFENIWIQPAAGDAGGALGCALVINHMFFSGKRIIEQGKPDAMSGSYLGPEFGADEVELMALEYKAEYTKHDDAQKLAEDAAARIDSGQVVGWFQGRMEWGPRALGNRSILGDARNPEMQKRMNLKIKYRESFRPFAPAVLYEDVKKYFKLEIASPYMLLTADTADEIRNRVPDGYEDLSIKEKLYFKRSTVPAVTHLDFSARLQTVHRETNPVFWQLLNAFKRKTGCGAVINTSFNVRGEPIVCTPEDAYRCFMRTEMDCLVLGSYVFEKGRQPECGGKHDREEEFALD